MSIGFLAELFIAYHASDIHGYSVAQRTGPKPPALPSAPAQDSGSSRP